MKKALAIFLAVIMLAAFLLPMSALAFDLPAEIADAFDVGVWPLEAGTYDPSLDGQGILDGTRIFGMWDAGFAAFPAPAAIAGYTAVGSPGAMTPGTFFMLDTGSWEYILIAGAGDALGGGGDVATVAPGGGTITLTTSGLVTSGFGLFDLSVIFGGGDPIWNYGLFFDDGGTVTFDMDVTLSNAGEPGGDFAAGTAISIATINEWALSLDDGSSIVFVHAPAPINWGGIPPETPFSEFPGTVDGNVITPAATYGSAAPPPAGGDTAPANGGDTAPPPAPEPETEEFSFRVPIEIWEATGPGGVGENATGFNNITPIPGEAGVDFDPELGPVIDDGIADGALVFALYDFSFATFQLDPWDPPTSIAGFTEVDHPRNLQPGEYAIVWVGGGSYSYLFLMRHEGPVTEAERGTFRVGPPAGVVIDYGIFAGTAGAALLRIVVICLALTIPLAIIVFRAQVREIKSRGRTFAKPEMMNRKQ
jgi:hypothetical protein